jgi:poly(A) polymerase
MPTFHIAIKIVEKLYQEGYTSYFAGGWVRDFLMHRASDDIDIATEASVEEVQRIFPKTIPVGVNFGIVIVVEEGHHFEVATFRKDQGYRDGRRPIAVESADDKQDAERRDFTINGMFYDPLKQEVIDYVEGKKDIEKGVIRAIGNPHERFLEDRLRMIRAVRYASRFHFSIEAETLKAILDHADALFPAVAIERVWNEFCKMAAYPHFDMALITLHRLSLLPVIFPQLKDIPTEEIKGRLQALPYFPDDAPVIAKIFELFPSISLQEKEDLVAYLKLSNEEREFVRFFHSADAVLIKNSAEDYEWAHLYAHRFFPPCLKIHATHLPLDKRQNFLQEHHLRAQMLKSPIQRIQNKNPYLTSHHLREAGVPNGVKMGELLKTGERLAVNEKIEDPAQIIERLKELNEL